MADVSTVLNRVMSKLGLDKRLREHTFLSLWPTFVPGAIADRSRALFIDNERNLVVSVADAATGQELSMMKSRLLSKVAPAARSLGIEIRGIRPDLKSYHSASVMAAHPLASDDRLPAPTEEELEAITLNENELQELSNLGEELRGAQTGSRMVKLYERELRIRRWRLAHKYPTCSECGNPIERLHKSRTGADVCIACQYRDA